MKTIGLVLLAIAILWFYILFFEDRNKHNMP